MADKDDRLALRLEILELFITFCLEKHVSDRQRLIDNEDLRINVDRHRKRQTHKHTAGIRLARLVYKFADIRKFQNIVQSCIHLLPGESHHHAVEIYVFDAGVFHVKARAKLQQRRDSPVNLDLTACG